MDPCRAAINQSARRDNVEAVPVSEAVRHFEDRAILNRLPLPGNIGARNVPVVGPVDIVGIRDRDIIDRAGFGVAPIAIVRRRFDFVI